MITVIGGEKMPAVDFVIPLFVREQWLWKKKNWNIEHVDIRIQRYREGQMKFTCKS